ncbi:amidohydrolase family protein [Polaribacter litorisediminis]|uniref:amidohydrolase family protein n=1 Tax=Polaribacter litorisediminis TaxID=1908341 RepID=UPI001CBDA365|nr:amidohydrolase family protein [Polaribacter litorisediminis]UAM97961.1 amidohydrolase family protein [Polaribacter litorisediminis]
MKRKVLFFLKASGAFICVILTVFAIAYLWPMSTLQPPKLSEQTIIKNVNIVDVATGEIAKHRFVLIEHSRITKVDTTNITASDDALIIDGTDKFLIPGLWDMHTHSNQHSAWLHHPLYIANGITGVRDMSGQLNERDSYWVGSKERLQWNKDLENNIRVTPRYVLQSSYQMDGEKAIPEESPNFFKLQKPSQVDSLLQFYKNEKVDFIKVYQQLPKDTYTELAKKAPNYGLHLAGHKPMFLSLEEAVNLGQRSFEHGRIFIYECFPEADSLKSPTNWKQYFSKSKAKIVQEFDSIQAKALMRLMHKKNTYWTPTLQTLKFEANAHKEVFTNNKNLKYITKVRKQLWWKYDTNHNKEKNLKSTGNIVSEQFFEASKKQVAMAHKIGVPIMAGTDVTDSYVFAGFSLHDELFELTTSGISNLEALQSATLVPAKFSNMEEHYGSVEIGKKADLVLLNKNPLSDIKNTKEINGVIINGMYYDEEKLNELKEFTETAASSFHMNVKTLISLVHSPLIRVQFAD